MSNSYTSPPVLVDPARMTSGLTIRSDELSRLGDMQNYAFAYGGCHDAVNQAWDAEVFEYDSTSLADVCEWWIPHPSEEHVEFKFRLSASTSVAGSQAKVTLTFPLSGNSYSATTTITDSSRFASVFDVITVAISAVEDELYAKCTLSLQASTGATISVAAVQGSWTPLASPLATRALDQYGSLFIPMGADRLGDDEALTARFGVDTLSNITQLRRRPRTLLNWSGVFSHSATSTPAKGLGSKDAELLFSEVALSSGMNLNDLDIDIQINAVNITTPLVINAFGYRLAVSNNGWNSFGLDLRLPETDRSGDFKLSMYRVGVDDTIVNTEAFLSASNLITSNPPYIKGINIMGV